MDSSALFQQSRARFDHHAAKRLLKEKYESKMIFAHAGGMWRSGPELHGMITTCGCTGEIVLPDLYGNPIKVDAAHLLTMSQERWQEQMNAWLVEYNDILRKR